MGKKSGGGLRQHVRWLRGLSPALGECEQALTNAGREASPPGEGGLSNGEAVEPSSEPEPPSEARCVQHTRWGEAWSLLPSGL